MQRARHFSLVVFLPRLLLLTAAAFCASCSVERSDPAQVLQEVQESDDNVLDRAHRQYLWDIEHLAFVLEQKVFPTFKKAISENEISALSDFLAEDFVAFVPEPEPVEVFDDGVVRVRQWEHSNSHRKLDASEFLKVLASYRENLDPNASACGVSIGLVRLSPADRNRFTGPWQGVWRFRLAGRRDNAPVELTMDLAVELDPLDEDLPNRRRWIRSASVGRLRLISSTRPLMAEVTKDSGIDDSGFHDNWRKGVSFRPNTGGVYLCDYNQDGRLDVLLEDLENGLVLYRGERDGRFLDVTEQAGLQRLPAGRPPAWVLSCWADFDGDGDEDLLSQNYLYENLGDGTFRDVTQQSNILLTPAAGYAVADYDLDGRVDLYVCHTNAYRVGQRQRSKVAWIDSGLGINNVLWRNVGDWQFEDVTEQTGTGGNGESSFSAVWFDANQDRRPDLLAINEFGENLLLFNQVEGPFLKKKIDPIFGGFSMGVTSGDYDNDGNSDIYIANMYSKAGNRILANVDSAQYPATLYAKLVEATKGNKLYRTVGDGSFEVVAAEQHVPDIGWTYGANFLDLDGDGFLDLYATAGFKSEERGKPDG